MKPPPVALSLKQPWATLVVHGLKHVEIRRWPTERRGRIYIHAAKVADTRPEAWARLPPDLTTAAQVTGGLVGVADITGCIAYPNPGAFRADQLLHFNDPSWFQPPALYGFVFAHAKPVRFRPVIGNIRFFSVGPRP